MEILDGGITDVPGFQAAGFRAGIKPEGLDMAVLYADRPCRAAAVFTKNKFQGACIHLNRRHLKDGTAQAIVINSGNANVATGEQGIEDCKTIATATADELGLAAKAVLVASTGLIGRRLPVDRMRSALIGLRERLGSTPAHRDDAARAILTTDTRIKQCAVRLGDVVIGGMAKGAGMIHPNMGTMLVFLATNAEIPRADIQKLLLACTERTFNMIDVDGDTSTSDSVILLASGAAGRVNAQAFQNALLHVMQELAVMVVRDGEGATKVLKVDVDGARSRQDAARVARAIVSSTLVKCSFGTIDIPGRILCAVGNADADFNPFKVDVYYGDICVAKNGEVIDYDRAQVSQVIAQSIVPVTVHLNEGGSQATAYGSDLTAEYIRVNAEMYT